MAAAQVLLGVRSEARCCGSSRERCSRQAYANTVSLVRHSACRQGSVLMPVRHFTLPPVPDLLGEPSFEEEQQVADDPSEESSTGSATATRFPFTRIPSSRSNENHEGAVSASIMSARAIIGSAPGASWGDRVRLAALRAVRTLLQGIVAAFPTAGAGTAVLSASYWHTFTLAVLGALVTALASFIQNISLFLPADPPQRPGV